MTRATSPRAEEFPVYTRAERVVDGAVHVIGLVAAVICAPVLVALAARWHGDVSTVTAAAVYAASLVAMFAASAAYHLVTRARGRWLLRRLDHAAIYVKIAGTYTPFAVLLAGERAPWILAGIWGAAACGVALRLLVPGRFQWTTLGLYLAMGWAVVVVGGPILEAISTPALVLVLTGGGLYTLGVVFHLWDGLPFQNAIWHALVLAASFVFYAAILTEVARSAPAA